MWFDSSAGTSLGGGIAPSAQLSAIKPRPVVANGGIIHRNNVGQMRKTPTDARVDFDDIYDFDVAFCQEFKIAPKQNG